MMMDDQQNMVRKCRSTSMLSPKKILKSIVWPFLLILVGWIGILAVFYTLGQAVKTIEVEGRLALSMLRVLLGLVTLAGWLIGWWMLVKRLFRLIISKHYTENVEL